MEYLNRGKEPLYPEVIYCEGNRDGVYVEVAMQHNDSFNDSTFSLLTTSLRRKVEHILPVFEMR